ncbi:MAG: helix-turn-helix domain-containing protein [bacterium]|nr:helix-turn-helix domain-containing protein [bacterium]
MIKKEYPVFMELSEVLEKSGLNQKEASVYLALLELGLASVESIAKKAGTKRPTTYLVLDDLQAKGLVSLVPRAKKSLYTAESPEQIMTDFARKQELVKHFLPEFLALYNAKKEKPQVQLFEGKEGMRQVYDKVLASPEVSFFCTLSDVKKIFPEILEDLKQRALQGKIKVRELVTRNPGDMMHVEDMTQHEKYENRFLPAGVEFLTDNVIFGDSVAFFSYSPYPFAVTITSRGITASLQTLFNMAWASADSAAVVLALENKANKG